jgi:predicted GIY-YIG superfamily endonuclease
VLLPDEMNLGFISDLDERLRTHISDGSPHTAKYHPWKIVLHLCFQDEHRAVEFERYLKSGSGHAFAKKRFW